MYTFTSSEGEAVDAVNFTWNHSAPLGGPVGHVLVLAPSHFGWPLST